MVDLVRFGYFFFPSKYRPPLGHESLDVYLSGPRSDWYFDTQAAAFTVTDGDTIWHEKITHPSPQPQRHIRVLFGRFYLIAYNGEIVEGCSLGGDLEIIGHGTHTSCHLTSPAPVFDMENATGLMALLEPEIEAEIARLRAEWTGSDAAFDRRLAALDPFTLFISSLDFIDSYLHSQPQATADDQVMSERSAVRRAIHTLQNAGEWPQSIPTLRDLILHP
jgi:hypothetical protein